jgi:hypothetical protein
MKSYRHKEVGGARAASFSRHRRGRIAGAGPPGLRRQVQAANAAAGEPEPHKECYKSVVNGDDGTCTIENVWEIKMRVFCGSGTLCPKRLCQVLFSGTDSPSLKMGMFCRKFVEDVLSKDCFVPRTVLSKGRFITKFLGWKFYRTFRSGTFRQGTRYYTFAVQ